MSTNPNELEVKNNADHNRYEIEVNGLLAELRYRRSGDDITLTHTLVPKELEGRGIAARLARTALEEARNQQLAVYPECSYVAAYIKKHPEYLALLPQAEQERIAHPG